MASQPTEAAEQPNNEQDSSIQSQTELYAAVNKSPHGVYKSPHGDDFRWGFVCFEPVSEQWRVYELVEDTDGNYTIKNHATNMINSDDCRSLIYL